MRSHPRIMTPSIYRQLRPPGDENDGLRSRYRLPPCGNSKLALVEPMPLGEDIEVISGSEILPYIYNSYETGDENGGLPRHYRPPWCGNLNLIFVEPAPPGNNNIPSTYQKCLCTSTTPNPKMKTVDPVYIPHPTIKKPQPWGRKASAIRRR